MTRLPKSRLERVQRRDNSSSFTRESSFPIVGIGASAGGLEAVSELLRYIPGKTGLAFVVVQHLDPSHKSSLSEILSRITHIPVEEARDGTVVEANHAYVIPPNKGLYIETGVLHLTPRQLHEVPNLPVDQFFCSLAADRQHRSIGVILSGTSSDGVEGCKVIKEAGGITFAQTEASAKYWGMPQSAVDAGCVDFVLSPKEIAEKLVQIGAHPYVSNDAGQEEFGEHDAGLNAVLDIVSAQMGIDFSQYKPTTLQRRIQRRMALHKFKDVEDYVRYVKETPKEGEDLYRDILITVTNFFRDPEAFESLTKNVFVPLFADRDLRSDLRIWVPGCATGEEAYSIAIALTEYLSQETRKMPAMEVQIFATDVNEASLAKARLGIYSQAIVKDLTPDRLHRFFVKQDGMYHVQKSVREMCVFARQNVAKDPPFSNLDLISCRNLLIYFGDALQMRVIPTFHYALRPGGYLILGGSETLGKFADQFAVVDKKHRIYQKKKDSPRLLTYFMNAGVTSPEVTASTSRLRAQSSTQSLERQFDRMLLETFGPSSIVVTEQMEIVHLRGNTGDYLQPPSGQPSFNLNKMARDGLLLDLRTAMQNAKKSGNVATRENVEIQSERGSICVNIEVRPFTPAGSRECYYIVSFHDALSPNRKSRRRGGRQDRSDGRQSGNTRLRQELAHAKEQLRALIEDYEATLEEYRSSNEEVLSSNEELQSLNEEMETAKEELQSTNEELKTVNEELQNRNTELLSANEDLSNLFLNVSIPVVMVNKELLVRRFTPQAQALLNLAPEDVERRLSELRTNLRGINLAEIAREVMSSADPQEHAIQAKDGTWYLMHVRTYKTKERHVAGAVLAFQNIDPLKRSLDEARNYTATLTESSREPILTLDSGLRVINANNSFYKKFLVEPAETEGRFVYELGGGQWNIPKLRGLLEDILSTHSRIDDFEVRADFPEIGRKVMLLNARRIQSQAGKEVILLAIEDVTELKRSEEAVRELSKRILNIEDEQRRRIARDLHDVTGQKVAALTLNVRLLAKQIPNGGSDRTAKESLELADQITNEIRGLSYVLHPPMLDELGLVPALREYIEGISERTGLRIELNIQEKFPQLADEIAITIFRVIQECLMNVHRHSDSSKVKIVVTHNGKEIELRVADFGRGAKHKIDDSEPAYKPKNKIGVGVAGMRERVKNLGGTFEFLSGENGTTVITRIPIPEVSLAEDQH